MAFWFPKYLHVDEPDSPEGTAGKRWDNSISLDGKTLTQVQLEGEVKVTAERDAIRITFGKWENALGISGYRFLGVYRLKPGQDKGSKLLLFERVCEEVDLNRPLDQQSASAMNK